MACGPLTWRSPIGTWAAACALLLFARLDARAQSPSAPLLPPDPINGPLIITTAGSMAQAMRFVAQAFVIRHPGIVPEIRTGPSVAVARAIADSTQIPDLFVSSDDTLIDAILIPRAAAWSAGFARSTFVLAYTARSKYADEITTRNWADVLSKPDVRGARGNPNDDPAAYRALMFFDLAARFYLRPQLVETLEHSMPITDFGPGDRQLEAMFADGTVDYMPTYKTLAAEHELEWLELPPPTNLGDTAFASSYAAVEVQVGGAANGSGGTITIHGSPILYGLTIPRAAPHSAIALAFAEFTLSPPGLAILKNSGFDVPDEPILHGDPPPPLQPFPPR